MQPVTASLLNGIGLSTAASDEQMTILTPDALDFIARLHRQFNNQRKELLVPSQRQEIQMVTDLRDLVVDFEDLAQHTWNNIIERHISLRDEVAGKTGRADLKTGVRFVLPRGWRAEEKHLLVDDEPVSASLFDFGLYFYHNVHALMEKGTGPCFYIPKMQDQREERLWNEVFAEAQRLLRVPQGTVKVYSEVLYKFN